MTDEEKSIDVAARQERLAQLLNGPELKPARRPRSDKGTVKGPKAKQQPGALTKDQVETIYKLIAEHSATKEDALLASTKALDAANRLELYLDSLTAKDGK